ncbi:PIN domain-containing protein [Paraburkholderia denitrificans]|uniref:PIN domain-containing protein n=1 Tax=Paraburkholderia denitrificans TaxID=694025 RepID=A0ABW0JEF6_9BURK
MRDSNIRSDMLKDYRKLYDDGTPLALLASLFQVNLILDANVVIRELIWATTKRKNPLGRSELLEVLEVETVIAWAPTFLKSEVEKYIPFIIEKGAKHEDVGAHWLRLRALINFVDVGDVPSDGGEYRDPKDVPYILLQRTISATIVTADKDIAAMGGRVAPIAVMATLRAYSRAAAVQVTFQVGGYALGGLGLNALSGAAKFVYSAGKRASANIPREVWLSVLAVLCIAMVNPTSRTWLRLQLEAIARPLGIVVESLAQVSTMLATEFGQRKIETGEALLKVHAILGIGPAEENS